MFEGIAVLSMLVALAATIPAMWLYSHYGTRRDRRSVQNLTCYRCHVPLEEWRPTWRGNRRFWCPACFEDFEEPDYLRDGRREAERLRARDSIIDRMLREDADKLRAGNG